MKRKLPIILPCMAALLLCVPLFARFFPLWAAKAPVFTDIIIETTAKTGINKQGELTLFRLLTVLGLLLCCLTGFLLSARQMKHVAETPETAQADKHPAYLRYLWIFVIRTEKHRPAIGALLFLRAGSLPAFQKRTGSFLSVSGTAGFTVLCTHGSSYHSCADFRPFYPLL